MSQQIKFYRKNIIDIDYNDVAITVNNPTASNSGQAFINYLRNRRNTSAWVTTGVTFPSTTTIDIDFSSSYEIDTIIILLHNLKNYSIQYYNGSSYIDFSTAINVTNGTADNSIHTFNSVLTNKLRMLITDVNGATDDNIIRQLIVTKLLGQLEGWPVISKATVSKNKKVTKMLSGRVNISDTLESVQFNLSIQSLSNANDLQLLESLYDRVEGFLVWPCAGDETQFSSVRKMYRFEDIFLMQTTDEWNPDFYKGLYKAGIKIDMSLRETVF